MSPSADAGSATSEYVVLLALVTITASAAVIGLGGPLLSLLRVQRVWLALPLP